MPVRTYVGVYVCVCVMTYQSSGLLASGSGILPKETIPFSNIFFSTHTAHTDVCVHVRVCVVVVAIL